MTRPRVRTAIVGAGFMGGVHLEALRRVGLVEVVAVASRNVESATRLAEEFGVDRATSDVNELLDNPQINALPPYALSLR